MARSKKQKLTGIENVFSVLKNPRITEKAAVVAEQNNTYVFDVLPEATSADVKKAIETIYKFTPIKVNFARVPKKTILTRRGYGKKSGFRKAYVYLKKGDKIELV